ncbi:hypothetical protein [Agrobacterium leguminum]|uniref:hypothetical protein n=1 Tax=Agrobacterium leguminum TaxID=2792015 RepID=UPI003CE44CED
MNYLLVVQVLVRIPQGALLSENQQREPTLAVKAALAEPAINVRRDSSNVFMSHPPPKTTYIPEINIFVIGFKCLYPALKWSVNRLQPVYFRDNPRRRR